MKCCSRKISLFFQINSLHSLHPGFGPGRKAGVSQDKEVSSSNLLQHLHKVDVVRLVVS